MRVWVVLVTIAALMLAVGCPAQHECRQVGVDVPDDAVITGRIIEEHIADAATVQARCSSPFVPQAGCAIPVDEGAYVIWSVDDPWVLVHERCHALYEAGH